MKVILLQDVAKIGRRSQIVEVPDGYARNQLIPKRLAEPASAANTKRIEKMQADVMASIETNKQNFKKAIDTLKDALIKIEVDANEKGHTFKAVSADEVVVSAQKAGVNLDAKMINFQSPIKEVGKHTVTLVLDQSKADFKIEVVKK
ncbi:50S ribosomal protein L9 [Candidatus Nomurabacteria bacterium]|nr:50S ribosomal protein L9 [Candidatus Kaiserbacteria bacterium]MCB9815678.1 50S ribosomal protein L9 [Candidatus Nomurabacteria bacterium]